MAFSTLTGLYDVGYPADNQRLPILVQGAAFNHIQEPIERPGGLAFHTLLLTAVGQGEVIVQGKRSIAQAGTAILLHADIAYAYRALTDTWLTHFVTFSGSACETILQQLGLSQSGVYHVTDPDHLDSHFQNLAEIAGSVEPQPHRQLSKILYALLLDLAVCVQYMNAESAAIPNTSLQSVVQYIESHYAEPLPLDLLAEQVGWRKEYLCNVFKKLMGQTLVHFIQSLRVAHARINLVQYPDKTIKEVAAMCGFDSASYFCRVFRQWEKMTPQRYRQQH